MFSQLYLHRAHLQMMLISSDHFLEQQDPRLSSSLALGTRDGVVGDLECVGGEGGTRQKGAMSTQEVSVGKLSGAQSCGGKLNKQPLTEAKKQNGSSNLF